MEKADKIKAIQDRKVMIAYSKIKKVTAGTGLKSHHLIEKRFAKKLGINANDTLSVALDKDTHKQITN